ncbi:hypothetical protein [Streptomyces sp. NPDC046887]|uniref:hypothetical protein n=1 Tax=Streptomyces sp. NPDC046887 TaxID=3155472 RepID=UPI0033D2A436
MLWILIGEMPLEARENLAYESRELYHRYGRGLKSLQEEIRASIAEAATALPKEVADPYISALSVLVDDAGVSHIDQMVDQLDEISSGQIDHSIKIQGAKWEIIAEIISLIAELAILAALAAFTGGTSVTQMFLARARSRLAVLLIVQRLLRMSGLGPALTGALTEALQVLAVQLAQIALNEGPRKPKGIDWKEVGKGAAFGALAGLFSGWLGGAFDLFGNFFKNYLKKNVDGFDSWVKRNPFTVKTLDVLNDLPEAFVVGAVSESAAEVLVQGIFEGVWEFKWETFVGSGTSSMFQVVTDAGIGGGGLWLNKWLTDTRAFPEVNRVGPAGGGPGGRGTGGVDGALTRPAPAPIGPVPLVPPSPLPTPAGGGDTARFGGDPSPVPLPAGSVGGPLPVLPSGGGTTAPRPIGPGPGPEGADDDPGVSGRTETLSRSGKFEAGGTGPLTTPGALDPPRVLPSPSAPVVRPDADGLLGEYGGRPSGPRGTGTVDSGATPRIGDETLASGTTPRIGDRAPAPGTTSRTGDETFAPGDTASSLTPGGGRPLPGGVTGPAGPLGSTGPRPGAGDGPADAFLPEGEPGAAETGADRGAPDSGTLRGGPAGAGSAAGPTTGSTGGDDDGTRVRTPAASGTDGADTAEESASEAAATPESDSLPPPSVPLTGDPGWEAAREAVPPVTREHVWVDPVSTPADPARPGQTTQYVVRSGFEARRVFYGGEWITDLTVRVSGGSAELPPEVWEKVRAGVEEHYNAPRYRLPGGELLHITVEPVGDGPAPHALTVDLVGRDHPMTRTAWWADAEPIDYAHEIGHQLGLRDESRTGPDTAHRPDVPGSLLGDYTRPAPDGLTQSGLRGRHLSLLAAQIGGLGTDGAQPPKPSPAPPPPGPVRPVRTVGDGPARTLPDTSPPASRGAEPRTPRPATMTGGGTDSGTGWGTGPGTGTPLPAPAVPVPVPAVPVPAPPAPVVQPASTTGTRNRMDGARPPRLERGAQPPAARRGRTRFADGGAIPAYIDDLASLLDGADAALLDELLTQPATFGQSAVTLRGAELIVAEAAALLDGGEALRPGARRPGSPPGTGPVAELRAALRQRPRTLVGGLSFPYTNAAGEVRILKVTARHYGRWQRFEDTYGKPAKIDTMDRATVQSGRGANVQSITQLGIGGPFLGPPSALAFGGLGRLAVRGGYGTKVGYGLGDQVSSQAETRMLDGSQVYLDDLYVELSVTDADGRVVTEPLPPGTAGPAQGAQAGLGLRDGLALRLPDSAVKPPKAGRIPRSIALDQDSQYRLVRTEGFGPVTRIRDWAAQRVGAAPGSSAYRELDAFFSSDSFQRHARMLAAGRLTTAPLFADDRGHTPLGVFVVERVVPVRATLIDETPDAELRDIITSTVRSDRSLARNLNFGLDGVLGPAFNFLDLGDSVLNLRLQFGPAFRYLFAVSRSNGLGGFGGSKTSGQVKGDPTGLYLVRKTVHVRHVGSGGPARVFHTWSVDRMTRTEARRLAGWDDGTTLPSRHGLPEPFAPAYLTVDHPPTLGMHRVEEFAHATGARTRTTGGGPARTLPDEFADTLLTTLAAQYPGMVAPLDQLTPPGPGSRWTSDDAYQTALANTLTVLTALSHQSLAAALEALTTTGIRVRLIEPGTLGRGHRYIWVHGELTNRRYEGRQDDLKLRHSAPGGQRMDGQESRKRTLGGGFDLQLAFRDPDPGAGEAIGAPDNAGVLSLGWRSAVQHDSESGHGASVTNEPMSVSTKASHLYRYDLALTVSHGGHWRFRGLVRGVATLGLLGTQPFVFRRPQALLMGTGPNGAPVGGGPVTGQVLISVPDRHTPAVDPHRPGFPNPYRTLGGALPSTALTRRQAHTLATGGPPPPGGPEHRLFTELRQHAFLTLTVVVPPGLVETAGTVMRNASGGSWQFSYEGAPAREAVLRSFQPQFATASFDQSSGPLGLTTAGLMGKPPYGTLWGTFRHFTTVTGIHALTGPVEMDTEMILGSGTQATGKTGRSITHSFGGQLTYAKPHSGPHGPFGAYGLVANPWSESGQRSLTLSRAVVADLNLKSFGHQVLVSGTVEHRLAMISSMLGTTAAHLPLVPSSLAGAAGSVVSVPGGWLAHVPEKSAHLLGILDDGLGPVPRYTADAWSPQPWMRGNTFGTYPVNGLDPTAVLADFQAQVAALGLDDHALEHIRQQVTARVLRALHRELTGTGASTATRSGGWGWRQVRIGGRRARVRVELLPGAPSLEMLDHSQEREENRRAVQSVQEGADFTSGKDFGILVGEAVHTGDPTAVAAGPVYTETGTSRRSVSAAHATASSTTYRAASTEPHAEITTPYRLRLTLEFDDEAPGGTTDGGTPTAVQRAGARAGEAVRRFTGRQRITATGDAGALREHVPLSLMAPGPAPGGPAPDPRLAPPDLSPTTPPRSGARPGLLGGGARHTDGSLRPFTVPENGFHVRRVLGLEHIREASRRAIAEAYGTDLRGLDGDGTGAPDAARRAALLRRASTTTLTHPGGGPAQTLEDATTNTALSTFYDQAATLGGYEVPGLTHRNPVGTDSARLSLHAVPDFSGAVLLTVADGMKMEVLRETAEGVSTSVSQENTQDSAFGGGVAIRTEQTGLNQPAATLTGPYTADGDGAPVGEDHLSSLNVKPKTGRGFLFAVPTDWLAVAEVHRGVKDSAPGRLARYLTGPFAKHPPRGPKAVSARTHALVWIRDDIARELGLIDDTVFPARVSAAWDAVSAAAKAWTDADKAYWKKRRASAGLREERDAAAAALDTARTTARDTARRLTPLVDALEEADTALADAESAGRTAHTAADALETAAGQLETAATSVTRADDTAAQVRRSTRRTVERARHTLDDLTRWAALPGGGPRPAVLRRAEERLRTAQASAARHTAEADRRAADARTAYGAALARVTAAEAAAPPAPVAGPAPIASAATPPEAGRARRTAAALRTAADQRTAEARRRQRIAARTVERAAREDTSARAARDRAMNRSRTAGRALHARRAELRALAHTAEAAATELHRVRAATDLLTRWHQLGATPAGRALRAGLAEPPPVTHRPVSGPRPPAPPAPPRPRYLASPDGTGLTAPDGTGHTLLDVPRDGDAFFHALAHGLAVSAPALAAQHDIDPTDPDTPRILRALLAARLSDPADADLLDAVAPDDTDTFAAAEIDATGPVAALAPGTPGRREFDQLAVVPHAAALDSTARSRLAQSQLLRPGSAPGDTGWDHSAADLLPLLAARTFGVQVTVVRGDGTFQTFTPGRRPGPALPPALGGGTPGPYPPIVLHLDDRHYRLAVPDAPAPPSVPPPPPPSRPAPPAPSPPGGTGAVFDGFEAALLTALGPDRRSALLDRRQPVPVAELADAGITVSAAASVQAVLTGGTLSVEELGLTPEEQLRWLLARRVAATQAAPGGADAAALAVVVAAAEALGLDVDVVLPGGGVRAYRAGPGGTGTLTLRLLPDGRWQVDPAP